MRLSPTEQPLPTGSHVHTPGMSQFFVSGFALLPTGLPQRTWGLGAGPWRRVDAHEAIRWTSTVQNRLARIHPTVNQADPLWILESRPVCMRMAAMGAVLRR